MLNSSGGSMTSSEGWLLSQSVVSDVDAASGAASVGAAAAAVVSADVFSTTATESLTQSSLLLEIFTGFWARPCGNRLEEMLLLALLQLPILLLMLLLLLLLFPTNLLLLLPPNLLLLPGMYGW